MWANINIPPYSGWLVCLLVGCGLTSHSAIFQLYSDGTIRNFVLLPGTQRHGQLGSLTCRVDPDTGTFFYLPPCHQRAHTRWGYADDRTRIVWSTFQPATAILSKVIFLSMHLSLWMNVMYDFICKFKGLSAWREGLFYLIRRRSKMVY